MHVATSSIEKLLDYVINTPEDGFTSDSSAKTIVKIINANKDFIATHKQTIAST